MTRFKIFFLFSIATLISAFTLNNKKITIHSIGDSTMCDFPESYLSKFGGPNYPIRGWMQMMGEFVTNDVIIDNAARSGRSTKSFRDDGFWVEVLNKINPGDYVFIMFGGNDQKTDSVRFAAPRSSYRENLIRYIKESQEKGAIPILFTSIVKRKFDKQGKLIDTYGDYVVVAREVAKEMNIPLIDLYAKTWKLVEDSGPEESKKLFLYIEPGKFTKLPDGKKDDSHLCVEGARKVAQLAAEGIKEQKLAIANYFK
ncbi:rhamnogalacturonan acetylesterase [Pedobacter psychrophilus]|uniref:Rhamnogalacturonan acetylesterase n=1 Tax=Pedobacter psychrophilus TaxID=1826909 RepID=A0A179DC27_9SPHI|nr:rhamnogalacturonan acetylesterase [Pedobacter psychrophilus]OAQ38013.1 rhamnogalacturonan acetylesterase [Pedobacter psychrophilus]